MCCVGELKTAGRLLAAAPLLTQTLKCVPKMRAPGWRALLKYSVTNVFIHIVAKIVNRAHQSSHHVNLHSMLLSPLTPLHSHLPEELNLHVSEGCYILEVWMPFFSQVNIVRTLEIFSLSEVSCREAVTPVVFFVVHVCASSPSCHSIASRNARDYMACAECKKLNECRAAAFPLSSLPLFEGGRAFRRCHIQRGHRDGHRVEGRVTARDGCGNEKIWVADERHCHDVCGSSGRFEVGWVWGSHEKK